MSTNNDNQPLTFRQRAAIKILFFIVRLLNPTGYTHEIDNLQEEFEDEAE